MKLKTINNVLSFIGNIPVPSGNPEGGPSIALKERITSTILSQLTTTIVISNGYEQEDIFESFLSWYASTKYAEFIRSLSVQSHVGLDGKTKEQFVPGVGRHYFVWKGVPGYFDRADSKDKAAWFTSKTIKIVLFTRDQSVMFDLIREVRALTEKESTNYSYSWSRDGYVNRTPLLPRTLESVVIEPEITESLVKIISDFYEKRDWHISRGLPYTLVICLKGLPRNGKSSIVRALACHFKKNLYMLNPSDCSDITFRQALIESTRNGFCLIEDFESFDVMRARADVRRQVDEQRNKVLGNGGGKPSGDRVGEDSPSDPQSNTFTMMTLSGYLNAMDGAAPLDGAVIFKTTNSLDGVDEAILGRIDYVFEIKPMDDARVKRYIQLMFGCDELTITRFNKTFFTINGKDLYNIYRLHHDDVNDFVNHIPSVDNIQAG